MISCRASLSLTSIQDLHNNVEAHGGRFTWPIPLHGLPWCQLFGTLKTLKFKVAKRTPIMSFEIKIDLLECGSKPCSFILWLIDHAHLPQFQNMRTNILQGIQCPHPFNSFLQVFDFEMIWHSNCKHIRFALDDTMKPVRFLACDWGGCKHRGWCWIESGNRWRASLDVHCSWIAER